MNSFIVESRKLEEIFHEDNEWVYQWCEFVQKGEWNKAKFIDREIRPRVRERMLTQLDITLTAMEAVWPTSR